jgi:hypothetical protein
MWRFVYENLHLLDLLAIVKLSSSQRNSAQCAPRDG